MKKIILLIIASCTVAMATAQNKEHFTFATSIGTGIDMSEPAAPPFSGSGVLCHQQTVLCRCRDRIIHS